MRNHEFFPGKIPPGFHHVAVTAFGGGPAAKATFSVISR